LVTLEFDRTITKPRGRTIIGYGENMRRLSAKQQKEIKTRQDLSDDCPACLALRWHPEWLDLNSFSVMIPGEPVGLTCDSVRGVCREAMKGKKKSAVCSVNCNDCGVDTQDIGEWYMVKDEVWAAAWPKGSKREFLCIGCLETRLERWSRLSKQIFRVDKWNLCQG
jgi:hypothetical protein